MYGKKCKSGHFYPKNRSKWVNPDKIIYRSGLELRYMRYFDLNPQIIKVSSEETVVPYILSLDGRIHRYFLDFEITIKDNNGNIKTYLIEIKPDKFTKKPNLPRSGRKTKSYITQVENWIRNSDKWKAARNWAEKNNMEFLILTEKDISK